MEQHGILMVAAGANRVTDNGVSKNGIVDLDYALNIYENFADTYIGNGNLTYCIKNY